MMQHGSDTIQFAQATDGTWTYLVARAPESLPPVAARDLELAWDAARVAALAARAGEKRRFRFHRPDGTVTDLALVDRDARCWAGALSVWPGLATVTGLSVCLRLLALVDLLARSGWASLMVRLRQDGAEIDAALWRVAATAPLTREARFDETMIRAELARTHNGPRRLPPNASGASA